MIAAIPPRANDAFAFFIFLSTSVPLDGQNSFGLCTLSTIYERFLCHSPSGGQ